MQYLDSPPDEWKPDHEWPVLVVVTDAKLSREHQKLVRDAGCELIIAK